MKNTIEGFSQEKAIELGLTVEDLIILRWFVDFYPSSKMIKMYYEDKEYALISYSGFIRQMPIISGNKRTVARKFQRLVDSGVLENATIKRDGTFSVYRFGENYEKLIESNNIDCIQKEHGLSRNVQGGCREMCKGVVQNCATGLYKNVQPNTNLINTNLINTNLNNNYSIGQSPETHKTTRFTPPTVDEIRQYCIERKNNVDPERFFDYYQSNGWKVGKSAMKDWKAAVRTWERRENNGRGACKETVGKSSGIDFSKLGTVI